MGPQPSLVGLVGGEVGCGTPCGLLALEFHPSSSMIPPPNPPTGSVDFFAVFAEIGEGSAEFRWDFQLGTAVMDHGAEISSQARSKKKQHKEREEKEEKTSGRQRKTH